MNISFMTVKLSFPPEASIAKVTDCSGMRFQMAAKLDE
jgi:hypothetical protein